MLEFSQRLAVLRCRSFAAIARAFLTPPPPHATTISSKLEETAHQLSTLDSAAALFFARSAHHDVQALLQIGKVSYSQQHFFFIH
jgi:hypothetical protein